MYVKLVIFYPFFSSPMKTEGGEKEKEPVLNQILGPQNSHCLSISHLVPFI